MVNRKFLMSNIWHFIALGFGTGLSKKGPGTIGTLVAFLYLIPFLKLSNTLQIFLYIFCFIFSYISTNETIKNLKIKDPSCVVIDEIIAYLLILIIVPLNFLTIILSFVIFRLLDIFKPMPINFFEKIPGAAGVIADDVVAAIFTILIIWSINFYVPIY